MQQLLNSEREIITFAAEIGLPTFFPSVGPVQVHGIEINEYTHELATATVWIGYIQWLRDNGFGWPLEPILKPLETVRQMDAILAFDERGNPVEPQWTEADVIVGNPLFLGGKRLRRDEPNPWERFRMFVRRWLPCLEKKPTRRRVSLSEIKSWPDDHTHPFEKSLDPLLTSTRRFSIIALHGGADIKERAT